MTVAVVRLGSSEVTLAIETFALMGRVFEEPSQTLDASYVSELLARDSFWALAAIDDGAPVGGLTAHVLPMTRSKTSELFLYDLAVHPARQRQGIGRALLADLMKRARAANVPTMFVPADNDDTHALDFYRAIGGTPQGVTIFTFE